MTPGLGLAPLFTCSSWISSSRQSSDVRSTPWRRPASPWPRGLPSGEFRNAGKRAEDTAIWPVGFREACGNFLSLPLLFDSRPWVRTLQPEGQSCCHWFLGTKLYGDTAMPIHLCIFCGGVRTLSAEMSISVEPEMLLSGPVGASLPGTHPSAFRCLVFLKTWRSGGTYAAWRNVVWVLTQNQNGEEVVCSFEL